jgi:hypothetical protein
MESEHVHIVTCMMVRVTNNFGIRRMIGFITLQLHTHSYLQSNTSRTALFTPLQFAVANALGFPLFSTSRLQATAFNTQAMTVLHFTVAHKSSIHRSTLHNSGRELLQAVTKSVTSFMPHLELH